MEPWFSFEAVLIKVFIDLFGFKTSQQALNDKQKAHLALACVSIWI